MSENDIAKDILDEDGEQVNLTRISQSPQSFKIALRSLRSLRLKNLRRTSSGPGLVFDSENGCRRGVLPLAGEDACGRRGRRPSET